MLLILHVAAVSEAFVGPALAPTRLGAVAASGDVWYAPIADAVQKALTNSPLNEGKRAFVKFLAGPYDEAKVRSKLESVTQDDGVVMLSFTTCPFCIKAKSCLDGKKAKYTTLELDQLSDGMALRSELGYMVGRTSVPAIFIGGQFIGGCNDGPGLLTLDRQGKLDPMLADVGAI